MNVKLEQGDELTLRERLEEFPWWLVGIIATLLFMGYQIAKDPEYQKAFDFVLPGIQLTIFLTIMGFLGALVIGLLAGLGRISKNIIFRNLATAYIEFVRGVPILVLIFTVAFVFVPMISDMLAEIPGMATVLAEVPVVSVMLGYDKTPTHIDLCFIEFRGACFIDFKMNVF